MSSPLPPTTPTTILQRRFSDRSRNIYHLQITRSSSSSASVGNTSTEPRFFQRSLLKFYEVSPWFSFPNNIANACILQILAEGDNSSHTLHIVDIGDSHGVQWPTFLEALTRGPEDLLRWFASRSAFKGRESEERRLMEGEAAKALSNQGEMNEVREKWCERMKEAGFMVEILGEDAIDGGKALLRKYENNWEMRLQENNTSVGLWWKGQPVSFYSLWKFDAKDKSWSSSTLADRLHGKDHNVNS